MGSTSIGPMFFIIPPDKSISHRALFFAALSKQNGIIKNLSKCEDVLSTLQCLHALGLKYTWIENDLEYDSSNFPITPSKPLDCGNSGTTARLLIGLLAGLNIPAKIIGDASLSKRPMQRVITPLTRLGASISHFQGKLPIEIHSNNSLLDNAIIKNPVPSAQVKSAIILAVIAAGINCTILDGYNSRNHTELMAQASDIKLTKTKDKIQILNTQPKLPTYFTVYGDPSSAFFLAAAAILNQQPITLQNIYLNKTRIAAFEILHKMGAIVCFQNSQNIYGENIGDITIRPHSLNPIIIPPEQTPKLIDEIPMLAILCCFTNGTSTLNGLGELKYKESNRLELIYQNLCSLGANIKLQNDSLVIEKSNLGGGTTIRTGEDHRIIMAFEVLNTVLHKKNIIKSQNCVKISFPNFYDELSKLHDEAV